MIYTPRTLAQNLARQRQTEDLVPMPEDEPVKRWQAAGVRVKSRKSASTVASVTKKTICSACGHEKQFHCDSPQPHIPNDDGTGWHSCILSHCTYGLCWDESTGALLCPCTAFEFNGKISWWKPPVLPETPCTRCLHPRAHHCKKSKDSLGIMVDGTPHACQHYPSPCTSTGCAEAVGPEENRTFCPCSKFISPYARRRAARKKISAAHEPCPPAATAEGTEVRL